MRVYVFVCVCACECACVCVGCVGVYVRMYVCACVCCEIQYIADTVRMCIYVSSTSNYLHGVQRFMFVCVCTTDSASSTPLSVPCFELKWLLPTAT